MCGLLLEVYILIHILTDHLAESLFPLQLLHLDPTCIEILHIASLFMHQSHDPNPMIFLKVLVILELLGELQYLCLKLQLVNSQCMCSWIGGNMISGCQCIVFNVITPTNQPTNQTNKTTKTNKNNQKTSIFQVFVSVCLK